MRSLAITLCLMLAPAAAHASSDEAQAQFSLAVAETCAASSGLDHARVSELILFDDTLNKVATLVTGIYPQPFMKGATGKVLCLYDKKTQKTWIDEATGWSAPDML